MHQVCDITGKLEQYERPALWVKDGCIHALNGAARYLGLAAGDDVTPLLSDPEEYRSFPGGCLFLSLEFNDITYSASITEEGDGTLWILDSELDAQLWALALASQQLRGPASELMLGMDRLLNQLAMSGKADPYAAGLRRSMDQLHRALCNMSDSARYSTETTIYQQPRDMAAIINEVMEKAATLALHKNITLAYTPLQEIVDGLADPEKIERAILNVISNALKATAEGGKIKASLIHRGNRLLLTIQDGGKGVAPQLRGEVFSQYRRKPSLAGASQGLGLGMVIVRAAAAAHGGTVLLEHPKGEGTRVTISLAVRKSINPRMGSPLPELDYAGGKDHALLELSDALPDSAYQDQ